MITKTYDLILWSCNHTSKFPRNHRFVLGETDHELVGHASHANTYRLRTDLFYRMAFQRAAAKPSSASGRDVQQSSGERPLGPA